VLRPPVQVPGADYLLVESTYGNRKHEASDALAQLETVINKTAARGGVVVIPAFAVGRAQSLMYGIYQLKKQGRIHQHLPVYLDSPMAIDATRLYHAHRDEHRLSPEECEGMCHAAKIVNKVEESKALSAGRGPMVIISASGMATGGRVVHHLKSFAPDHRNTILFAGYQAGGTRGARDRARRVHRPHPWPGRADPRRGGLARQPFRPRRCRRDPRVDARLHANTAPNLRDPRRAGGGRCAARADRP